MPVPTVDYEDIPGYCKGTELEERDAYRMQNIFWAPKEARRVFVELTDVYLVESDLKARVEAEFEKMIDNLTFEKVYPLRLPQGYSNPKSVEI